MQDKVRVALVGTSYYPDWMHLPALKSHPNAQIAAICGRNRERAEELGNKYEIPNIFTDYREMFDQGNLDAAIIATPDDTHYPITMAALDAGLHVICEKPLAFTLDEAKKVLSKAESAKVKHMTYFTYRFIPHIRYLFQLVDEGYIGNCYDAQIHYLGSYGRQAGYHWQWDRQHGLGVLGNLGSHTIDLAHRLVGAITEVQASFSIRDKSNDTAGNATKTTNDSVSMMVRFSNDATGTIFVSDTAHLGNRMQEQRIVLYGDKGTLEAYASQFTQSIYGIHNDETEFQKLPIPENLLQGINQESSLWFEQYPHIFTEQSVGTRLFIDSIIEDKPITPSFYDGMRVQAVIEAAYESDLNGVRVKVR